MSHSTPTAEVRGSGNLSFLAQGNIQLIDQYVLARSQFSFTDLVDVQWSKSPAIVADLLLDLRRKHLLVLGGKEFEEKTVFARHLALCLSNDLRTDDDEVKVWQWHPSSGAESLEHAFDDYDPPAVFVFSSLQPHHLSYDLGRLHDLVTRSGRELYAIVATDSQLADWGPGGAAARDLGVWQPLAARDVYEVDFLGETLRDLLLENAGRLPDGLVPDGLPKTLGLRSVLAGKLTLRDAAARLATPSRVRSFVNVLVSRTEKIHETWLLDTLEQHAGHAGAVHKWYRQLAPRDQLQTLGFAFFDGLFDDQVFAALEVLVNTCWRAWDPSLAHFDYHDLERVRAYFQGAEGGISRIEWSPEHRREVLKVAWRLHRRRLLSTVPWLVRMVKDSAQGPSVSGNGGVATLTAVTRQQDGDSAEGDPGRNDSGTEAKAASPELTEQETQLSRWYEHGPGRDLFGSTIRRFQLRRAVADTLCQLGRFSVDAIERALLDLAEDGRLDVQIVAATAMAGWRASGPWEENGSASAAVAGGPASARDRLFRTLSAWLNEAYWKELSQRLRRRHRSANAFAHIRATAALTVGYAAFYDQRNEPEEKVLTLLDRLLGDRHPMVRDRLRSQALPILVAWHLKELEAKGILREKLLAQDDLLLAVASGIAFAFTLQTDEAEDVLSQWRERAGGLPRSPDQELGERERLLATVALAYGRIRPDGSSGTDRSAPATKPGTLRARQIVEKLQRILVDESHPAVRQAVLVALTFQTRGLGAKDLRDVAAHLRRFLREVTIEERAHFVDWFTRVYLEQRRTLGKKDAEGDDEVKVEGTAYRVWKHSPRPLTLIEKILYGWLRSSAEPAAQQVAFQAFAAFSATPLERQERALGARGDRIDETAEPAGEPLAVSAPERSLERLHQETPRERLATFAAAPFAARYRRLVAGLLPEYFALHETLSGDGGGDAEKTLELLLARFENVSVEGAPETARYLRRAVHFHALGGRFIGGAVAALILAALVGVYFVVF